MMICRHGLFAKIPAFFEFSIASFSHPNVEFVFDFTVTNYVPHFSQLKCTPNAIIFGFEANLVSSEPIFRGEQMPCRPTHRACSGIVICSPNVSCRDTIFVSIDREFAAKVLQRRCNFHN